MKKYGLLALSLMAIMSLQSCDIIGGIFKAGMWWAFILIFGVIGGIIWLFTRGKS